VVGEKGRSRGYFAFAARGMQPNQVRHSNQRAILSVLAVYPGLSNADIARRTGLAPQTVSSVLDGLEEAGLLLRGPVRRGGGRGQPATPLYSNPDGALSLGAEIGWTHIDVAMTNLIGQVIAHNRIDYAYPDRQVVFGMLTQMLEALTSSLSADAQARILGLGLAVPGGIGRDSRLLPAPPGQAEAWADVDVGREAANATGYDVQVFNDGNAACFAEFTAMPPPRPGDFAYLLIDTFVGAGIVAEDRLWEGVTGASANIGSMLVSDRSGASRFVHELASLLALEKRLEAAGTTLKDGMSDEPSELAQTVIADWIEDASSALAHAILNTATVIEFDFAVIDSALPASTLRQLIEATSRRMLDYPSLGRPFPAIRVGHIGRPAAAQGAAQLRMYRRFYSRELAHMDDS